jgi:hypothetical protein
MKPLDPRNDLKRLPKAGRAELGKAADCLLSIVMADLARGTHVIARLKPKAGLLRHWDHLPAQDVKDETSGACWFYHAHPPEEASCAAGEHGHFHLFVHRRHAARGGALQAGPGRVRKKPPQLSHLVALAMRSDGVPLRWFTVAQAVTGDYVYPADAMQAAARHFEFRARGPLAPTTRWLMAMVQLYQPTLRRLLTERDKIRSKAQRADGILSIADVQLPDYLAQLEDIL